jgi:hypothetical protein
LNSASPFAFASVICAGSWFYRGPPQPLLWVVEGPVPYVPEEEAAVDKRLTAIEMRLAVLTWMVGAHIVLTGAIAILLLRVAAKVGAL